MVVRRPAAHALPAHGGARLGQMHQRWPARLPLDSHQRRPQGQAHRSRRRRGRGARNVPSRLGHAPVRHRGGPRRPHPRSRRDRAQVTRELDTPYRGGLLGGEHHFALSVYFEDTDAYGIVYYANYLNFMEQARTDLIRAVGVDQAAELRASGSAYAVVEVDIHYRKPARLGDDLVVISTIDQIRASSVLIHQRVMRGKEQLADA